MALQNFLGDYGEAGDKMKESGTTHWETPNFGATNETSFNALPGGCRSIDSRDAYRNFSNLFRAGYWWSSSEYNVNNANYLGLSYKDASFEIHNIYKFVGLSVRCIKDIP